MIAKLLRVLVADDSDDDRALLAHSLRRVPQAQLVGMTIDGVDTVAWLSGVPPFCNRKKYPFPDLLLLDYQMPGYSGLDVMEWLCCQPRRPTIVLWSHMPELIDRPRALELGAAVVCEKPDGPAVLASILVRVFAGPEWIQRHGLYPARPLNSFVGTC